MPACFLCAAGISESTHVCPHCARDLRRLSLAIVAAVLLGAGLSALSTVAGSGRVLKSDGRPAGYATEASTSFVCAKRPAAQINRDRTPVARLPAAVPARSQCCSGQRRRASCDPSTASRRVLARRPARVPAAVRRQSCSIRCGTLAFTHASRSAYRQARTGRPSR